MQKSCLVSGCTGQDGSYLMEILLERDHKVVGMMRRTSTPHMQNIEHIIKDIEIVEGDMCDYYSLEGIIDRFKPDLIFNLAAQSHVATSFSQPEYTMQVNGLGAVRLFEAVRKFSPNSRIYQASTSELFSGKPGEAPQSEVTPLRPQSPYGNSKLYAHTAARNMREAYGMFISTGLLFNHESSRRGEQFVTRKITKFVGRLANGKLNIDEKLKLGNPEARRDWGHSRDYMKAALMMLQHDTPDEFVIASGETRSVREFADIAFKLIGKNYQDYVITDESLLRPNEVSILLGDCSKAKRILGWRPQFSFDDLIREMVENDIRLSGDR